MKNHCAFSKNHSCPLWTDYELTCYELEEANSLCHGNWIEIERQYKFFKMPPNTGRCRKERCQFFLCIKTLQNQKQFLLL